MFSAALAMLVCGWPGPLYPRLNTPSMADTFTTYRRGAADAVIAGRSRLTRMNGVVTLHSWTSSSSSGSTSSTRWIQLLVEARSGASPPASIAVPAAIRSGEADPAISASAVSACGGTAVVGAAIRVPVR